MRSRLPVTIVVLAALAVALGHAAPAGAAQLTLRAGDAPGFKRAKVTPAAARRAVGRGMGARSARIVRRSRAQGIAFRRRGWSLRSYVLPSAGRALAGWRAAHRRAGWRLRRGIAQRGGRLAVAWRQGRALGVIEIPMGRGAGRGRLIREYARLAQYRLRDELRKTVSDRVLERIPPRGRASTRTALQAFSLAYGRLPGVRLPRGRRGRIRSGTLAMALVLGRLRNLTAAQRRAVRRELGTPVRARGARLQADPTFRRDTAYQRAAERFFAEHARRVGVTPALRLIVGRSRAGTSFADARPQNPAGEWVGSGETPVSCRVRVHPSGQGRNLDLFLAHEVFHCLQYQLLGPRTRDYIAAGHHWTIEGLADYAALTVRPGPFAGQHGGTLRGYVLTPTTSLFSRAYDASGFFGHAEQVTGDVFRRVAAILNAPSDEASFAAAGGLTGELLNTWGSRAHGVTRNGSAWIQSRPLRIPGADQLRRPEIPLILNSGQAATLNSEPYASQYFHPAFNAPVVQTSLTGHARLADGSLDTSDLNGRYFCTIKKCECPKGTEGRVPPTTPLGLTESGLRVYIALSGAAGGSHLGIRGLSLEEFCKRKREPSRPARPRPGGRRPSSGRGSTNGDPHMRTGDRLAYDFQAAGEFTLARSTADDLEIQARQEPMLRDDSVTINSAVATNVAGTRVGVYRGSPPVVRVNGLLAEGATALPRGGRIERDGEDVLITWPDGSEAFVWPVGDWGVAVSFSAAPERAGKLAGLLGNYDGNPGNDLTTRDGQTLDPAAANQARATEPLYNRFGESWRIAPSASLFDYEPGRSTASYTNRALPKDPPTPSDWARRVAEAICRERRIADPQLMRDCVLDVSLGGDDAFAEAAAVQQVVEAQRPQAPAEPETPIAWTRVSALDARAGEVGLGAGADGALHAVAAVHRGDTEDVVHVPIAPGGGASTVVAGVDGAPTVTAAPGGGLHATMPAIHVPSNTLGTFTFDAPASGTPWTQGPMVATGGFTYAGYGIATYGPGGQLLTVLSTNGFARVYRGTQPGAGAGVELAPGTGCFSSSPAIASDGQVVWAAWEQFSCAQEGVFAVRIDPATGQRVGAPEQIPGARAITALEEPVALAARPDGGGVWIAYAAGDRVRVARLGTGQVVDAATVASAQRVALTADPSGRLWVAWQAEGRLRARRTAPDATLESPTYLPTLPPGHSPFDTDWEIQARAGQLDLLAGATARRGETASNWHGAIRP